MSFVQTIQECGNFLGNFIRTNLAFTKLLLYNQKQNRKKSIEEERCQTYEKVRAAV